MKFVRYGKFWNFTNRHRNTRFNVYNNHYNKLKAIIEIWCWEEY